MYNFNTDQGINRFIFMHRQLSDGCVFVCYCLVQAVTVLRLIYSESRSGYTYLKDAYNFTFSYHIYIYQCYQSLQGTKMLHIPQKI